MVSLLPLPGEKDIMPPGSKNPYERAQDFNFLTRWLHGFRYKEILEVIGQLARQKGGAPVRVFEIGSAYGKLFGLLNDLFNIEYTGIELYKGLYDRSREMYGAHPNAQFIHGSALDDENLHDVRSADIVIALETLEHIPDEEVPLLLEKISARLSGIFVCSVPVEIGPSIILKNVGSFLAGYSRHREYSWKETLYAGTFRLGKLPPHETGHKGFDWRKLLKETKVFFEIRKIKKFPFSYLPSWLATSVFLISAPRRKT